MLQRKMNKFQGLTPDQEKRLEMVLDLDQTLEHEVFHPKDETLISVIEDGQNAMLKFLLYHELVRQGRIFEMPR